MKMKKSVLVLLVSLCLVMFGLATQKTYAVGWPTTNNCDSNDDSHFPYHFLCGFGTGSTNNQTGTLIIGRASTVSGSSNTDYARTGTIDLPPGVSSVDFAAGFDSGQAGGGIPRSKGGAPAGVLVWIYVLPNNPDPAADVLAGNSWSGVVSSTSTVKGFPGVADQCPGWGSKYGKVYNFQDNATPGSPDQSPAAYSPGAGQGFENCHDTGAMAYWKLSEADMSTKPDLRNDFRFKVNLDNKKTGSFCIREEVSVIYPGTADDFPAPKEGPNGPDRSDAETFAAQNYNANHVAKQSNQLCYQAKAPKTPPPPPPPLPANAGNCTEYHRTGTAGTYAGYQKRTFVYSPFTTPQIVPGLAPADSTGGYAGTADQIQHSSNFDGHGYLGVPTEPLISGVWQYAPSQPDIAIIWAEYWHYTGPTQYNSAGDPWIISGDWYQARYTGGGAGATEDYFNTSGTAAQRAGGDVYNCFHAKCTIVGAYGIGTPNNVVQAGQPYVAFINILNDNGSAVALPLFKDYFGAKLGVNSTADPYGANPRDADPDFPDRLNPGEDATMYYVATAPASGTPFNWALDAYPDYHAGGASVRLGDNCAANGTGGNIDQIPTYAPFSLSVHASLDMTPSEENPTNVAYRTWVTNSTPATASAPQSSLFFERPNGVGQSDLDSNNSSGPWPPGDTNTLNGNRDPRPVSAGDEYCSQISIAYTAGLVGPPPANTIVGQNTPSSAGPTCRHVHNKPYVHVLGSDASAGGGFGKGCTSAVSGINTYLSAIGAQPVGSGAQFGAVSIGGINGFSSTTQRPAGTPPIGSTGLTFGNVPIGGGGLPAPALGGNMGGGHCVPDFFASMPAAQPVDPSGATKTDTTNFTTTVTNEIRYFTPGGGSQLKINNSGAPRTLADRTTLTIYVDGDVHIKGNIAYTNTNWGAIDKIPSFQLIVKGDIFIDSGVTQLDGLYVAQPNGGTGGNIYTCASPPGTGYTASNSDLLGKCHNQLVVNGAFVAQKVFLSRSFGSLRNSYPGEHLVNGTPQDCTDSGATNVKDCAAEIFNFSPELYLAQPGTTAQSGPTTGKYDFITSLAPVL